MTSTEPLGTHVDLEFCYINGNFTMGRLKSSLLSFRFFLACPHCHFSRCRSRRESDLGVIYKCAYLVHSLTYRLFRKIFYISSKENLRQGVTYSCYIITSRINLSTQMYLKYVRFELCKFTSPQEDGRVIPCVRFELFSSVNYVAI